MREVELKAVVDDVAERRKSVEKAGGTLSFEGKISDRRYDFSTNELASREEITTPVDDLVALETILQKLGLEMVAVIDREIAQYQLGGATIRFEVYPRMDALVEVEGEPAAIESAIDAIGLPRGTFSNRRLADFVLDFERRTGVQAA